MGIARHQHLAIVVALLYQFVEEHLYGLGHLGQFLTGEQLQVDKHLIVARTA